jgi:hypothetical protein
MTLCLCSCVSLLCVQKFRSERYLDRHLDLRHSDTLPSDSYCAADLCSVFACGPSAQRCNAVSLARYRARCRGLFATCFPPGSALHSLYQSGFCDKMACDGAGGVSLSAVQLHTQQQHKHHWRYPGVTVLAAVLALAALLLGAALWVIRRQGTAKKDLRRRSRRGSGSVQSLLLTARGLLHRRKAGSRED